MSLPAPVFATSWCSAGDDTIYLTAPNPTFNHSLIQSVCFTCTIRIFFIAFLMQFFLHRHVPLQRYNSSRLLDPFAPFPPTWTVSAAFLCVCFDFASASSNLPQESVQHSFLTSLPPRCNLLSIRPLSTQWLELFPRLHFPTVSQKNIYTFMNPFIQRLWTNCIAQCHSMTRIGPLGRSPETEITSLHSKAGVDRCATGVSRLFAIVGKTSGCHWHLKSEKSSYLVFRVEQFQLVVHQGILRTLLFPQCTLFLQLRTPKGLDRVHGGAKLLVGQLQFLLEVCQVSLEVGIR